MRLSYVSPHWMDEGEFSRICNWKRKFSVWPRMCTISGSNIFLTHGYVGSYGVAGPVGTITIIHWISEAEHIMLILKEKR